MLLELDSKCTYTSVNVECSVETATPPTIGLKSGSGGEGTWYIHNGLHVRSGFILNSRHIGAAHLERLQPAADGALSGAASKHSILSVQRWQISADGDGYIC